MAPTMTISLLLGSSPVFTNSRTELNWLGQSQSQSYFTTGGLPRQAPWEQTTSNFIFQLIICGYSPYVTSCLTRGWVCRLQLLLVLASEVILRSESRGTHDHISLSEIRNSPNLEGQVPVFVSPRNRMARLYPQALGSLFIASYDSQGYGGGIRPRLHTGLTRWPELSSR
jgi:hypothetical protein